MRESAKYVRLPSLSDLCNDRLSSFQCCESFIAGFDYVVLNNVYVYRLGFLDKSQLPNTELIDDDTSNLLFEQFREDLAKHYSNTARKC